MTWTGQSFSVGQILTAAQLNALQADITAAMNGDSGAPPLQAAAVAAGVLGWEPLDEQTASTSSILNVNPDFTGHSVIAFVIDALRPANNGASLKIQTSPDGSTVDTGASDYKDEATAGYISYIAASGATSNNSAHGGVSGVIYMTNHNNSSAYTGLFLQLHYSNSSFYPVTYHNGGLRISAAVVQGVHFSESIGNIADGSIRTYGIRNS